MAYALRTLIHERSRYLPGVLAVAFSAVLMALQVGLMLGLFEISSIPVDRSTAHTPEYIWCGSNGIQSVDLGRPIPVSFMARLTQCQGVQMPELFIAMFANFEKNDGSTELCFLLGSSLTTESGGANVALTQDLRNKLSEPRTIVMDESDLKRMKLSGVGDRAKINGKEVTLVGVVTGTRSIAAPWCFCSVTTARELLGPIMPPDYTTYLLARCESPERAKEVVRELKKDYPEMTAFTSDEFSFSSRWYWLTKTKAGVAIGYAAMLGLLVGAVVTMQTLYAATMASAREYATLLALGIPRWRIGVTVIQQSFWIGLFGVMLAFPVVNGLAMLAELAGTRVILRWEVLGGAAVITLTTAVLAGLFALRGVRQIEPMSLLR
ncbi:MAG: ABC transporter permease [Gemmataceae bacterium]